MASRRAVNDLAKELGALPPKGLAALADDELDDLTAALRAARRRQAEALEASGEASLRHIPALLRRPVRKLIGA